VLSYKKLCYDTNGDIKYVLLILYLKTSSRLDARTSSFIRCAVICLSFNDSFVRTLIFESKAKLGKSKALAENYEADKEKLNQNLSFTLDRNGVETSL
jgi:hypothetical protein